MANFVIKRDGTKEAFDEAKIRGSVRAAALVAGLEEEGVNELVEQVSSAVLRIAEEREEIETREIRDKIISELDLLEPSVATTWRKHEQEKRSV